MVVLSLLLCVSVAQLYFVPAAPVIRGSGPALSVTRLSNSTFLGRYEATLAVVGNPQPFFHAYAMLASGSDCGREWTTRQAKHHKCLFATNASPFRFKPDNGTDCLGPLVSDGKTVVGNLGGSVFGLTLDGRFVLGNLGAPLESNFFSQLFGAFEMVVVNGTAVPDGNPLVAPRTAIGVDRAGRLMIFEADGAEKFKDGLTTAQLGTWMASLGAVWAINLDGGGSSTVAYPNGELWSRPTCIDIPWPVCERAVTTITCITSS
jgi:exopolysaccharide biosynthesis protein